MQDIPETRKLVRKLEHTIKFFELETQKTLDVIRITLTDHKKQMNDTAKNVIMIENMFVMRDMKNKQLEDLIFNQRE